MTVIDIELAPAKAPIPKRLIAGLRLIYSAVPPVECKGLCQEQCTNVPILPLEALYLIERYGAHVALGDLRGAIMPTLGRNEPCEFLTAEGRCSIYANRPLVCRQYGHDALTLKCKHGCEPVPATLTNRDAFMQFVAVGMLGMKGISPVNTTPVEFASLLDRQIAGLKLIATMEDGTKHPAEADYTFDDHDLGVTPANAWEE